MEVTREPQSDRPALQELLSAAVQLFNAGDLNSAVRYLTLYVSSGGPHSTLARNLIGFIAGKAVKAGAAYRDAHMLQHARLNLNLAVKAGAAEPAAEARNILRKLPPPPMQQFMAPAPAAPSSATAAAREWRRPHMRLSKETTLEPGDAFDIDVFADQSEPQPGEESTIVDLPGGEDVYKLDVTLLASAHFTVDEPRVRPFRIERGKIATETISFHATVADVRKLQELGGQPACLCAAFSYHGRPSGKVQRMVEIAGVSAVAPGSAEDAPPPRDSIALEPGAAPADLNITIAAQAENDFRHFWCTVQTNLLLEYRSGVTDAWITNTKTGDIVSGALQDFAESGISPFRRLTRLRGAGKDLFDVAPDVFKQAFWKLIDSGLKFKTISIVSAEPYIPWELMIPYREARGALPAESRDPLGVEFRIGRMTRSSLVSGTQNLTLKDCYVIAPVFEGTNSLPYAQEEKDFILKNFTGDDIDPASLETLDARLKTCRSLIHFACHGEIDENGNQELYLAEDEPMSARELRGMDGPAEGVPKARPLVFLNACKAGQPVPALVGAGGLAQVFAGLGAGAVVAPLWSVKDKIAHEIALDFYQQAKANPKTPLAEILQQLRAKAYDPAIAEDTYAAYCFYGDPLATPA